jgi:ERF superfamily
VLAYRLYHAPSGQAIGGDYPLSSSTPQTMGGAITYARRYCLLAVTGAAPDEDDDDAQAAEQAARAQRNMPPEVDEYGAATVAEQTRMIRGHEPGVERLGTTPVDDPWLDPAEPPEKQPGSSLKSQRQSIYIELGKRRIKDYGAAIERLLGRDISEPADMSHVEATSVLARVKSWDGRTEELLSPLAAQKVGT